FLAPSRSMKAVKFLALRKSSSELRKKTPALVPVDFTSISTVTFWPTSFAASAGAIGFASFSSAKTGARKRNRTAKVSHRLAGSASGCQTAGPPSGWRGPRGKITLGSILCGRKGRGQRDFGGGDGMGHQVDT